MRKLLFCILPILVFSCSKPQQQEYEPKYIYEVKYVEQVRYIDEVDVLKTFSSPMKEYDISSKFGFRKHPLGGAEFDLHKGIDMVGPKNSPIYAAQTGRVVVHFPPPNGYFKGHPVYGGLIIIDHGSGVFTLYGHMKTTFVTEGMEVKQGQKIGIQGSTGQSTGPHLHYEVIFDPIIALQK